MPIPNASLCPTTPATCLCDIDGRQRTHEDFAQEGSRRRWIRRERDWRKLDLEEFVQAERLHPDAVTNAAEYEGDG